MANDYFNNTDPAEGGQIVRAQQINNDFAGVAAGFDKVPSPTTIYTDTARYCVSTGATQNIYVLTYPSIPVSIGLVEGMNLLFKAHQSSAPSANAISVNVNGLGVRPLRTSKNLALGAADIVAGTIYNLRFDGAAFQVTNTLPSVYSGEPILPAYIGNDSLGAYALYSFLTVLGVGNGYVANASELRPCYMDGTYSSPNPPAGAKYQNCGGSVQGGLGQLPANASIWRRIQ